MLTQDLIDDLSDKNWVAVTSADQIAFVTPIFSSSEETWTHGVVVWRLDTAGCAQILNAEKILTSTPPYIEAFDIRDVDADFSEITDVGSVLRLIADDDSVPLVRTERASLDLRRMLDERRCEIQALERHTTVRLYSSSISVEAIKYLWKRRAKKLTLSERSVRTICESMKTKTD